MKIFLGIGIHILAMIFLVTLGCTTVEHTSKLLTLKGSSLELKPGDILDTRAGALITFEDLIAKLSTAEVVYLGETHTSIEDHQIQRRIVAALYERNPSLIVAMEMFPKEAQPVLDQYSRGQLSEKEFLQKVKWDEVWGYPYQLYRGLLKWVQEKNIELVALNAPPEVVKTIARSGIASLTPEDRARIARKIDLNNPEHRRYILQEYRQHQKENIKDFESFYEAQLAWEETMAERLGELLEKKNQKEQIIVIIGKGHILHHFGVPQRAANRYTGDYKTIVPIPENYPEREIDPSIADYVWVTHKSKPFHHRGRLGILVQRPSSGDGLKVMGIVPESPAAAAGFQEGDILFELNGHPVNSVDDVRKALSKHANPHRARLRRGAEVISLDLVVPEESDEE